MIIIMCNNINNITSIKKFGCLFQIKNPNFQFVDPGKKLLFLPEHICSDFYDEIITEIFHPLS